MKRLQASILCFICILVCISCQGRKENTYTNNEEQPEKLVVYVSGLPNSYRLSDDSEDEKNLDLYSSYSVFGTLWNGGEIDCDNGNVFSQALLDYGRAQNIEMEIHFIQQYTGVDDVFQEIYDQGRLLPDVMVLDKHCRYDYYCLAKKGFLMDFSSYMERDEVIVDEEKYYQTVIDGGNMAGGQYVMPILFSMNGMITSDSFLRETGLEAPVSGDTYAEMLRFLEQSCQKMVDIKIKEALYENAGRIPGGQYFLSILSGAAQGRYFDDQMTRVELSEDTLTSMYELMLPYIQQEYNNIPNRDKFIYSQDKSNALMKRFAIENFGDEAYQHIGVFLSGGRGGGINLHNNLLTDVMYFHSAYEKDREELIFRGIPCVEDPNAYTANISAFALGFQSTKYPETVYQLMRYLMDYSYPRVYGFSVNKEITNQQIEDVQGTSVTIYPQGSWSEYMSEMISREELQKKKETVTPLDARSVESIRTMLNHISEAGLPFGTLEWYIYHEALNQVADGNMTPREGAKWTVQQLENYLTVVDELKPFYDAEYQESIKVE